MLSVEGLSLSIRGAPVLSEVSFEVRPGEVFGLVGESGSGKSMTALSVMRLEPRGAEVTGRVVFEGRELLREPERRMNALRGREVGMIFQEPMTALNPVQTIGAQVAETLLVHGATDRAGARAAAEARLARVGLPPERCPLSRYPHELSGGQRQRVCIAMAVALRPKLLIADEPTTALDVTTQAQILDLVRGLVAEEGMSLMLITHDLAVVSGMADRVAVMKDGRIVEQDATERLFRGRSHPYTEKLFSDSAHVPDREPHIRRAPVLEVVGLVREYPGPRKGLIARHAAVRAVDGVDLTVHAGESVGLVGESGCGKSTLTRAILGLEGLQGGAVRLEGAPVVAPHVGPEVRRRMQVVFQDPYGSFNPRHRVDRLVAEPFHLEPVPEAERRDRVAEALEAVGLKAGDGARFIHEFSGGQRQRIAIARAIVIRPSLVILDEAVSALDVSIRARILDLLAALQGRFRLSYLFISHDLSVVRAITDRVLVMKAGRIVEEGATAAVFDGPEHPYTKELIAAVPRVPEGWVA
ncbi:dipeptide ABC transporter ATP-binding protein [Psychromarinibacter sp. C21-152]|uniref:Dipeptide ABC transporter ATP-binding protein n=1 Tax=Psychromarinibacter sediminicola TaxID=3033385 RepID=A0AAE3T8R9_9RHOB|nr:dipeptide ABC transporter ATP-binding protein [Psychromarinibacter sediminicola]MDF0600324.1 dipeptide ABC transporter ATP-binding protein [Psychromarinibacter sediminicola]